MPMLPLELNVQFFHTILSEHCGRIMNWIETRPMSPQHPYL